MSGLKILSYILSKLHDKTPEEYFTQMLLLLNVNDDKHRGNLFTNKSWSYPDEMDLHDKYYAIDTKSLTPKGEIIDKTFSIPEEYKMFSSTESQYCHNENSVSDSSVLVLCDDSIKPLVPAILSYKDVFLYQDLWYFNKDLVEWLKPDDILEIRAERTLENAQYQLVSIRDNFVIPITRKVEKCCVDDGILTIKIIYHDLRSVPVSSTCVISVDKKILDKKSINGVLDVCYDINEGRHVVEVLLEASNLTKSNKYKQVVGE